MVFTIWSKVVKDKNYRWKAFEMLHKYRLDMIIRLTGNWWYDLDEILVQEIDIGYLERGDLIWEVKIEGDSSLNAEEHFGLVQLVRFVF